LGEFLGVKKAKMSSAAFEANAQQIGCGAGSSFCKSAMKSSFQDTLRSDACAIETYSAEQDQIFDQIMWLPSYASELQVGSAFLNASVETNRFAPKQVQQESFLQGRGQVSSNPGCKDSALKYLPQELFTAEAAPRKPWDMNLFAQPTLVPRSCASVTELDLLKRMKPLAGAYENRFSAFSGAKRHYDEGVTLSSKRYPDVREMAKRDRYAA